jgi:hypothetical protein
MLKTIFVVALAGAALAAADARDAKKWPPGFDQIKSLEGTWESDNGATITFKVTSAGSAVMETIKMKEHGEMVTMYHADGDALVMTHYCAIGNQPHMKADKDVKDGVIKFVFTGGSNMKETDMHMHALTMTIGDKSLKEDWVLYDGGKAKGTHSFTLKRKEQAGSSPAPDAIYHRTRKSR